MSDLVEPGKSAPVTVRHAEISSEFLNGGHARGDGHFLCHSREGIVQAPGGARSKLVDKRFEIEVGRFGKQTDRQNTLYKDIVKDRLRVSVRQ